jgi:hypothetical protein
VVAVVLVMTVGMVDRPLHAQSQQFGLEWDGSGAVRRMLYWQNPPSIYPMTYVFRVFPREKSPPSNAPTGYYTTFFWGNNGTFGWDGGNANTYYGAHPYPVPAPNGAGQWEISVYANDYVTGNEVQWGRWYTQVFRAWRESATTTRHEFYWDWPDTTRVVTQTVVDPGWADSNPPAPAIVVGQAADLCGPPPCESGQSWGGYPGWEEFNGIIRGIQMYSGLLSLSDVQEEIASPKSSANGRLFIWYLNLDPRPSDVADKRGVGTPNNPAWAGTTATEWSSSGASSPPPLPPPPPLPSGADFTIAGLTEGQAVAGSITVGAVPSSGVVPSSVHFTLINAAGTAVYLHGEGVTPYCLNGDDNRTCFPYNTTALPDGPYTLRVGMVSSSGSVTKDLHFTIANGGTPPSAPPPPPPSSTAPPPTGVTFTIQGVTEGQAVRGSIQVEAAPSGTTPSEISFALINAAGLTVFSNPEHFSPYCLNGDNNVTCSPYDTRTQANGTYTLRVVMTWSGGTLIKNVHLTIAN